jgi:hypothetical protein
MTVSLARLAELASKPVDIEPDTMEIGASELRELVALVQALGTLGPEIELALKRHSDRLMDEDDPA